MIKRFKHKGLKKFFHDTDTGRVKSEHVSRLWYVLQLLHR